MANNHAADAQCSQTSDYRESESFQVEACSHVFTFYPGGSDRLKALLRHIDEAEQSLDVFYYLFQDDSSGTKVRDALAKAAGRGVAVSLIIDDFGSDAPVEFFDPIVRAGGQFAVFSARWNLRYLVRNHQKFVIADNARVMTGGANVSDHYFEPPQDNGWCDLGVAIEGDVASKFTQWFALLSDLTEAEDSQFSKVRQVIREWDPGSGEIQLLMGGPLSRRAHWSHQFKQDLDQTKRLDIVTAYFGPPRSFRRAIARVARRGEARLIVAGKSDLDGTIGVARLYYRRLIKAGARVFEFQPSKLHMKLIVADNCSYFGSANLDRRSIHINIELMVRVRDEALAERLRGFMTHLESASVRADMQWYKAHSGFFSRITWRLYHWLSLADDLVARSAASSGTRLRHICNWAK